MQMAMNPMLMTDFYKVGHSFQYPDGITLVYSNLTPRKSRIATKEMVFFGLQYFIKTYLIGYFNDNFFHKPLKTVLAEYKRRLKTSLGDDLPSYQHIIDLHTLGYLPVRIKAVPEGTVVPMRVPCLTICNTDPKFAWVTNFLETLMSNCIWQACTSATIAHSYRKVLDKWQRITGMPDWFTQWQGHDFSYRGMSSPESGILSGMGHLLSFTGTDTIPAIEALEQYYGANADNELIGGSVPATEHSVMCAGGNSDGDELATFRRLITKVYPKGIVSIVSDTWDLWKVLTEYMPALKGEIMARDGKVVIRPDSGDPVDIICGNPESDNPHVAKGVVELLWDVFGGEVNANGFKVLDSHVGAIYGDSITLDRAEEICKRLAAKGFASQCVLGIGSFTYQYNTRDTMGMAVKSTYCEINGEGREIFKSPITDDGTKHSARGLLRVDMTPDWNLVLTDQVSWEMEAQGVLETVFLNGVLMKDDTLANIRSRLKAYRDRSVVTDGELVA